MPLFDDFERVETRPRRQNESGFDYMNASARPGVRAIRGLLEQWFDYLPLNAQADMRGRFRSRESAQHESAFFELYWHELLRGCGFAIDVHPTVPNAATNPDFAALRGGERRFYLEATLAMPPGDAAADRRFAELHDTLDRMNSPDYFVEIQYRGTPQGNVRGRVIREKLERWLRNLDYAEISRFYQRQEYSLVPNLTISDQECLLTFTPIPKGPEMRGQPGVRPVGIVSAAQMRLVRTHEDIRTAIEGKATKYGDLDCPLIVALNVLDDFCDDQDIWNALFGEEQVVVTQQADGRFRDEWGQRVTNGAWRGRAGARNQLVSAVSIVHQLSASTLRTRPVTIIHNPWATRPLPISAFPIPQATISMHTGQLQICAGRDHADILGIPSPWPEPD